MICWCHNQYFDQTQVIIRFCCSESKGQEPDKCIWIYLSVSLFHFDWSLFTSAKGGPPFNPYALLARHSIFLPHECFVSQTQITSNSALLWKIIGHKGYSKREKLQLLLYCSTFYFCNLSYELSRRESSQMQRTSRPVLARWKCLEIALSTVNLAHS